MKNNIPAAAVLFILITAGAFLLVSDDDSTGAQIKIFDNVVTDEFTYVYDDSGSLDLDGIPGTKEVTLISYNFNGENVKIPSAIEYMGETYLVTAIASLNTPTGQSVFYQKNNMKYLEMGDNVRRIGDSAFRECVSLLKVDLNNVTDLGAYSFFHCTSLKEITAEELLTVGNYAFAISDVFGESAYTGPIPHVSTLSLPKVTAIGTGAFGAVNNQSLARDFDVVNLPECISIGQYAFAKAKINISLSIPKAETIGNYSFYLGDQPDTDSAPGYSLSIQYAKAIGAYAFSGRALTGVALSPAAYTIGNYAFYCTDLKFADLGMVTGIGTGAFDGISGLQYFVVDPLNNKYASLISKDNTAKGAKGALYELDPSGDPKTLIRLPYRINTQLADLNNKFTVADGVKKMADTAFNGCPAIEVDLNEIESIPVYAFTNTYVTGVTATKAEEIGVGAFFGCGSLSYFKFLDTGGPLVISDRAFQNTGLTEVDLPKNTTVGSKAFSDLRTSALDNLVIGVWGNTVIEPDSFTGTTMYALQVSSDSSDTDTVNGAEAIFKDWNADRWTYGGSDSTGMLIINNEGLVDISDLVPDGQGYITVRNFDLTAGALQFVEYKDKKNPKFHMLSLKPGVYGPEMHDDAGGPIDIMADISNTGLPVGTCQNGDGKTWELVFEYYRIDFYSFLTDGDNDGDGCPDGEDPDYDNPLILSSYDVADRSKYEDMTYLAGVPLKTMLWPDFVRFSLQGWYAADNPDHALASTIGNVRITAIDVFGSTIPEDLIYRDSNDLGILNLYALFIGKEYMIEIEARVTSGQHPTAPPSDQAANPNGGSVELILDIPYNGSNGFVTAESGEKPGYGEAGYPYSTTLALKATPKTGYAFVGWGVLNTEDKDNPVWMFFEKSDRSYVNSAVSFAEWGGLTLSSSLKYVAYFAKTATVTFDTNDGNVPTDVKFVVGDYLVEPNNDYNGIDYDFKAGFSLTADPGTLGNDPSSSYYPGTPSQTGLTFGGWYGGSPETCYAEFDGSNLTLLKAMPDTPSLTLKARWYANVVFYANNGINGTATMSGSGLAETAPGSGIYAYRHDVGSHSGTAGGYTAALPSYLLPAAASDVNFNGWYVLNTGGTAVSDIGVVAAGTNSSSPYPDLYETSQRFEAFVQGDMSLMALYSADVSFFFNGATLETPMTGPPYTVAVPVSLLTLISFGDPAYFSTIDGKMTDVLTATADIHKEDEMGKRMHFIGWYDSADGTTMPPAADPSYSDYTGAITENIKLIAGWGFEITFDDAGVAGTIIDQTTMSTWMPGSYHFLVLEGSSFDMNGSGMPLIRLNGVSPTSWFDADSAPYRWFGDAPVVHYTYSVCLTPEFRNLFQFDLMGGTPATVQVPYSSTDTFADVLDRLNTSLFNGASYIKLEKTGLRYEDIGTPSTAGEPNAVWYKGAESVPDYVTGGPYTSWGPADLIGTDTQAYIRWLADVEFDVNVLFGDAGTSSDPAAMTVDEGTPFLSLGMPPGTLSVPVYDTNNNKTFKGWFIGTVRYTDQYGVIEASAGNITSSITLVAHWGAEVKFYYTGDLVFPLPAGTAKYGTDAEGNYIIIDVAEVSGSVTAPALSKPGFLNNHLIWYENGFTGTVPLSISAFIHSAVPGSFDLNGGISANKTIYARWYAVVDFHVSTSTSGFFDVTKNLLEGTKLSDLFSDLGEDPNPYAGDPTRTDWEFVGWYDVSGADPADYDDLGKQYYTTGFDYLQSGGGPDDSTSSAIEKDVTLYYEFVVLVNFDCGYTPVDLIDPQYLRVERPLPDNTSVRFTPMPARSGVAFTGWYDFSGTPIKRYTLAGTDAPDPAALIIESMTLTAAWLVEVQFYDLPAYLADGLVLNVDGVKIIQMDGGDMILNSDDDFFHMPEGTALREFILADPVPGGKRFVSWFIEQGTADGTYETGDVMYGLTDKFAGNITLTAGYGNMVHFDTNGGTPSAIPDMLVIEDQSIILPEKPAKGRLKFIGWYDGSATVSAGTPITPAGETWYSAKWLVEVKIYDGISMTPVASMEWDEDLGISSIGFGYDIITDAEYGGRVIQTVISWTDTSGTSREVTVEKFIDKYDPSAPGGWVSLYSVFNGWQDPFTGTYLPPTDDLSDLFISAADSAALFATWQERARFYESGNAPVTYYVDTGTLLKDAAAALSTAGWADAYGPLLPLNPETYRIRDSGDFKGIDIITVTFDSNGGNPPTQVFSGIISGTMLGAIAFDEPVRSGMYFAGWYSGSTRMSFTDKLYSDTVLTAKWSSVQVDQYILFAFADTHTNITPSGAVRALQGDTVTFGFYAEAGYRLVVLIDGKEINSEGMSSYSFKNITADHSIEVKVFAGVPVTGDTDQKPIEEEGDLAVLNLICVIVGILISIIALTVAYKRNFEGTGTGKGLRLGAVIVAVVASVIFLLTEEIGGSYVAYDSWTAVMFALLVVTVAMALISLRYDYRD
ncbi:MAG: leucine-rich repeat protein [Candidatus Methanoplasma sp.]|jgi:hypothetical protein|nr:leucine-rich repeat protein [Candidatus Methanoplasma sp.]